jgi:hypothetical protein
MKYIKLKALIQESNAQQKLEALPKGKLFNDAKSIKGVFDSSSYTWSQAIEAFETNSTKAKIISIPIDSIKITQPNIQLNKVLDIILKLINMLSVILNFSNLLVFLNLYYYILNYL